MCFRDGFNSKHHQPWQIISAATTTGFVKDTPAACELRCHGPVQLGFVVNHSGQITRVTTGTWAAENGLEAGDEVLAIDGRSWDDFSTTVTREDLSNLRGPRRLVVRAWATALDLQEAVRRSVASSLGEARGHFREALQDERRRFAFREALQAQLAHWRPRETWPFPALPKDAVDTAAEVGELVGAGTQAQLPRVTKLEAAARRIQARYRWMKLWRQLDTAREREAAATKIQAMQRGRQARRGLAAQFAASAAGMEIFESDSDPQEPSEGEAGSSEREVESPVAVPSATSKAAEPAVKIQKTSAHVASRVTAGADTGLDDCADTGTHDFFGQSAALQPLEKPNQKERPAGIRVQKYPISGSSSPPTPQQPPLSMALTAMSLDGPSASGTDPALVAAAVRIQAAERGRQARKRARKMAAEFLEPAPALLEPKLLATEENHAEEALVCVSVTNQFEHEDEPGDWHKAAPLQSGETLGFVATSPQGFSLQPDMSPKSARTKKDKATAEPAVGFFGAAPEAANAAVSAVADPLGLSEQLTLRPETDTSRPKPEAATSGQGPVWSYRRDACSSSAQDALKSFINFVCQATAEPAVGFFGAAPEAANAAVSAVADPLGLSEQLTLRPETDTSRPKPEAATSGGVLELSLVKRNISPKSARTKKDKATAEPAVGFFGAAPEAANAAVSAVADPLGLSEQLTLRPETDTSRPKPEAATSGGVNAEPSLGFLGAAPAPTKAVVSISSDPLGLSENLELQPQRGFRLPARESKEKKLKAKETDKSRDKGKDREQDRDKSTDKVKVEPLGFFGTAPDGTKAVASTATDPLGLSEQLELQPQRGFRLPAKAKDKDAKESKEKDTKKKKKKKKKEDESELDILGFSLY
ncbi:unnamed protein product [Symbiodinium sp. CCMP2592]|nr:unnamed protein product [Symbiodinium sp. CCMP2592]